jgi:hypothetical protein
MNCTNQSEIIDHEDDDNFITSLPLWVRGIAFVLMPTVSGCIIALTNLNLLPNKHYIVQNIAAVKNMLTT